MLFQQSSDSVHVLNGSAAFIWDCLTKPVTVEQVEAVLGAEYDLTSTDNVAEIIRDTLSSFIDKGLATVL